MSNISIPGPDVSIMLNMYASLGGLAGILKEVGVINRPNDLHDLFVVSTPARTSSIS